ncbi:MAG: MlaD family protein [Fulvivirga sp.]|nr:MlaD family protein [Fulvivirga sp.]
MKVSKELKVGLFMVLTITILYVGFNYLKGIDFFSTTDKYYAIYENVDGLNTSNPVYINGFVVGRVSDIKLLQKESRNILVEIDIDGEIILGDSATATLNSDFLGNKSILLYPGNIQQPIEAGDTLIARLDRGLTDILAESAQPVANNLEATIKKINGLLDQLSGSGGKVDSILNNLSEVTADLKPAIKDTKSKLDTLLVNYNSLGKNLNNKLDQLEPTFKNMKVITDSLKTLELNNTIDEANKTLKELRKALDFFTKNEGTLNKLVTDDSLYVNLNRAVLNLDTLINHFDSAPKDFLSPLGRKRSKIERKREKEKND